MLIFVRLKNYCLTNYLVSMKRILLLSLMFLAATAFNALAQRTVSGTIIDDTGESLPGVNVVIKGTTSGTTTDLDGNYRLQVDDGAVLVISFVGFETQEIEVGTRSVIDVTMGGVIELQEIVVTAYGEDTKRSLTGSVSSIGTEIIENQQIESITRSLQGTVPGINVIASSGQPGSNSNIRIRGIASIDSGNDPLIVLDGSPYSSNINTIPSSDIASISVLKDASAAALYGSRAGNGVILITTKSGKIGATTVDFRATSGVSSRARDNYEFVDAATAMRLEWETIRNDAITNGSDTPGQDATDGLLNRVGYNPYGNIGSPIDANGDLIPEAQRVLWDTDWEDAIFTEKAVRNEYSLGVSGGTQDVKYFFGGSLLDQQGQVVKSDFVRYTGRLNIDAKLNDWLSASLKQSVSSSEQNSPPQSGTSFANNIQWINTVSNIYPVYRRDPSGELILDDEGNPIYDTGDNPDETGELNTSRPVLSSANPAGQTRLNEAISKRFFSTTNAIFEANFLENFTAKTSYQLNKYIFDDFGYTNSQFGSAKTVMGRVSRSKDITTEYTWTNSLNWNKFFSLHNVDVLLLSEIYNYEIEVLDARGTGVPFDGLHEFNSTAVLEFLGGSTTQERIASLMSRVKYNYNSKYFLEFSYRQDQSSRFSSETRKGDFFAVSGAWLISDESFLSQNETLSFLKIRGSWGQLGNNNVPGGRFPYLTTFDTGFDQPGVSGIYPDGLANSELTWEVVTTTNIGLDFGLFSNKLTGTIDAYNALTTDLVTSATTTISRGVRGSSIVENTGDVANRGIEVSLASNIISNETFTWSVSANIAFEENEITNFPEEERISGSKKLEEGRSIFDFYIEDYAGVNPENGNPMWWRDSLDMDGNIVIERHETTEDYDGASRYFVGTALPWARGGISNQIAYKGIDFSFLINFSLGGKILDYDYAGLMHGGRRAGEQHSVDIIDRWQQPGDVTDVPRLGTELRSNSRSTRFLYDATYGRLRNITVGYTLPKSILNRTGGFVKNFRIFFSGDNLVTLFGRDGLDPEQSFSGITDSRSAVFKTYSGGIELRF